MSRLIREYQINETPDKLFAKIHRYLTKAGFQYVKLNGENVFAAGNGVTSNQTFFKFSQNGLLFRMETWMLEANRFSDREIEYEGAYAIGAKIPWRRHVEELESIITGRPNENRKAPKWMLALRTLILVLGIIMAVFCSYIGLMSVTGDSSPVKMSVKESALLFILALVGGMLIVASDVLTKVIRKSTEKPILFKVVTPAQFALLLAFLLAILYVLFGYVFGLPLKSVTFLLVLAILGVPAAIVLAIVRKKIVNRTRANNRLASEQEAAMKMRQEFGNSRQGNGNKSAVLGGQYEDGVSYVLKSIPDRELYLVEIHDIMRKYLADP